MSLPRRIGFGLYLLASVAVLLLAAEGVLRLVDVVPRGIFIPRFYPDLPGDLEPNMSIVDQLYPQLPYTITATPQGTRGLIPFSPDKPAGTLRVLCLGDSFTFGYGVDDADAYPELLRRELAERYPGRAVEVVNAGLPLFGILEEMDYYQEKGRRLGADVVVLQFFPNDLQDMLRDRPFREIRLNPAYSSRGTLSRWLSGSKLMQLAANLRFTLGGATVFNMPRSDTPAGNLKSNHGLDPFRFEATAEEHSALADRHLVAGAETPIRAARVWQAYLKAVAGLRDQVRADGAELLFVALPDLVQVQEQLPTIEQRLAPFLAAQGIPAVDMLGDFRRSLFEQGVHPYLTPRDDHCSPYGNLLIARAVADALVLADPREGRPRLGLRPLPPLFAREDPRRVQTRLAGPGTLEFVDGPGIRARTLSARGLTFERETSVAIDFVKPTRPEQAGEIVFEVASDIPLARLDVRLPCSLKNDPGGLSLARLEVSLDGRGWRAVHVRASDRSGAPGTYEQYAIVDCAFGDAHPTWAFLRLTLAGEARLYNARSVSEDPSRQIWIDGFPARPEAGWQP